MGWEGFQELLYHGLMGFRSSVEINTYAVLQPSS